MERDETWINTLFEVLGGGNREEVDNFAPRKVWLKVFTINSPIDQVGMDQPIVCVVYLSN